MRRPTSRRFVRSAACARVLLVDVVFLFLASLAQEAGEEQAAQAPTARYAAADQEAREPMVVGSAAFLLLIRVVVVLLPASLLKEAGQEQATQAPTARYAAANQEAREPMVVGSAAFLLLIRVVVVLLPASLLKEAGQEQATQAPTARDAAANQEAREPMVVGSAAFLLLIRVVVVLLPASLLKEAGQEQATQAPTARYAADQEVREPMVVGSAAFLLLIRVVVVLLPASLPVRVDTTDPPSQPVYLDWAARETPSIALAGAAREALRMVDVFEAMLRGALDSLNRGDRKRVTETARMDHVLDRLDTAIKKYLTSIDIDALDDTDHRRLSEILAFTTNLEHAGDILEKSLMPLAAKRIKRGVSFSEASREEIREMIDRLTSNARAAAAVFMTEDPRAARQLQKEVFRELELRTADEHFGRARAGRPESIEMSKLRLDIVLGLKRVNAHLAAAAYPILEGRGELLPSRLKQD